MFEFHIGDSVQVIGCPWDSRLVGLIGTVIDIHGYTDRSRRLYKVEFGQIAQAASFLEKRLSLVRPIHFEICQESLDAILGFD